MTTTARNSSPLARLICAVTITAAPVSPSIAARAHDQLRRADEQSDLIRCDSLAKPGRDHLADGYRLLRNSGKRFHLWRRAVEYRNDAAALVLDAVAIA